MVTKVILCVLYIIGFVSSPITVVASHVDKSKLFGILQKEEIRLQKELETNNIIESEEIWTPGEVKVDLEQGQGQVHNVESGIPSGSVQKTYIPIVYWHGMGDSAVNVKRALHFIEDRLPGVYVKSLQIGNNMAEDIENGYFMNVNDQVDLVCQMLKNDSKLHEGYNAIGLSQGGQFLRAVAQRCPDPPMVNLISLGGQHQGVWGVPKCQAPKKEWCEIIDKLLTHVAYASWVQKFLVQAEYWHDPFKNEDYISKSVFLADINNEHSVNQTYIENLKRLENFVLVLFEDETVVQPKQSEWFGFFKPGSDQKIIPLEDSVLYQEDRLGLKHLNENGKMHFLTSPGDHLQFTQEWFLTNIVKPFLS